MGMLKDTLQVMAEVNVNSAKTLTDHCTNEYDVQIVTIIAGTIFLVILCICLTVIIITMMKKRKGIKIILKDLIKDEYLKK